MGSGQAKHLGPSVWHLYVKILSLLIKFFLAHVPVIFLEVHWFTSYVTAIYLIYLPIWGSFSLQRIFLCYCFIEGPNRDCSLPGIASPGSDLWYFFPVLFYVRQTSLLTACSVSTTDNCCVFCLLAYALPSLWVSYITLALTWISPFCQLPPSES